MNRRRADRRFRPAPAAGSPPATVAAAWIHRTKISGSVPAAGACRGLVEEGVPMTRPNLAASGAAQAESIREVESIAGPD